MEEQNPWRRRIIIGLVVLAILIAGIAIFGRSKHQAQQTENKAARLVIQQRRQAVITLLDAIKIYTAAHKNIPPKILTINNIIIPRISPPLADPTAQKSFIVQPVSPDNSYEIQYAIRAGCNSSLDVMLRTKSKNDFALLIQDELSDYFCLSNHVR